MLRIIILLAGKYDGTYIGMHANIILLLLLELVLYVVCINHIIGIRVFRNVDEIDHCTYKQFFIYSRVVCNT